MSDIQYMAAKTVRDAVKFMAAAEGKGRVLAGGTDLLVQMKSGMVSPGVIIDVKRIPEMVSISERPSEIEDRAVPGHWEGDLLIGKASRCAIATLVERQTRFTMLVELPHGRTAESVRDALTKSIQRLPQRLRRSLTWDQGKEMAEHTRFTIDSGVKVYFCDPSSPWQRGSNENTNGLLRQYFPKGTDLTAYNQQALDAVADELNGRPRQTLGWMKPSEAFDQLIAMTA